ncbi:MAG: acetyl-CoA synthetase [Acidimicrobiia bacterium]
MGVDQRAPCIIGVAQRTERGGESPEPLELWEDVCRRAAADAGARCDVLGSVQSLQIVYCQSWRYDDPPARLAERLGIDPAHRHYSGIGGTTPQVLVNRTAAAMLRGEVDLALICGAEALETLRQARKAGRRLAWSFKDPEKKPFPFEAPFHPAELAHNVLQAWVTFPLWDVARRARLGVTPEDYRRRLGELLAPMTRVAAANPYAWFRVERDAADLLTPRPENRMVGYPYTKYMVSIMDVDMAAAVVVATHQCAEALGVPADRRVYLRGWCYGEDPTYVAEHPDMASSPAMRAVLRAALANAGADVDDLAHLDLYSCFASSVNFALDALGLPADDPRGVTVTGGLPFFGGAGSDYMTHSIATMAEVLRADPGSLGLVTGVGMHMTKHVAAVYSTEPGPLRLPEADIAPEAPVPITEVHTGPATVAAYTVAHGRDGSAEWGLAVCDLPDGSRAYARVEDPSLLAELEREEWVGRRVDLVAGEDRVNRLHA